MTLKSLSLSLLLLLSTFSFVFPQAPAAIQESKEDKEKAQKELERKTLTLLDDTLENAQALKLAENRALFKAEAADLLWARDEKRARNLFRNALADVSQSLTAAIEKGRKQDQTFWSLVQLRYRTVFKIARRDAQLALDLLHSTRPVLPEGSGSDFGMANQELVTEQGIAMQLAENDPKKALQMAEESLAKGLSPALTDLLRRLQQKDSEAATRFAGEIVAKLRTEDLAVNHEAAAVAFDLLRSALLPPQDEASKPNAAKAVGAKLKPLTIDDQTIHDLAETVVNASLSMSSNGPGLLMQMRSMSPELEKLVPERAAQLRRRLAEADQGLGPEYKAWLQMEPLIRSGSVDAMLDAAAKAPLQSSRFLYSQAAWQILEAGDTERARQVVTEHLTGQERDQMLAQIDRRAIARAVEQGKLDEAKQITLRIKSKEVRAEALAQLAMGVMATKQDRKLALQLMVEAKSLINVQPENERQIAALLQVARAYAVVDPPQAFELLNPLIDQANEMLAAAALLEKFGQGQGAFKNGEMILLFSVVATEGPYSQYLNELGALAHADFERTKSLADRFQRNEVRLLARLIIAQSILSDRPPLTDFPNGRMYHMVGSATLISY